MVSNLGDGETLTYISGEDFSGEMYRVVYLSAARTVSLATNASSIGEVPVGIQYDNPSTAGREMIVKGGGRCSITTGAAVTAGARATFDSSARAIDLTAETEYDIGVFETATNAAGGVAQILLSRPVILAAS